MIAIVSDTVQATTKGRTVPVRAAGRRLPRSNGVMRWQLIARHEGASATWPPASLPTSEAPQGRIAGELQAGMQWLLLRCGTKGKRPGGCDH